MNLTIITGASAGIGAATAAIFVKSGATVINISRRNCTIEGVQNFLCDLNDATQIQATLTAIMPLIKTATSICVVHNACKMIKDAADHCDINLLTSCLNINILAPTIINQILLPVMPKSSSVIYIGSTLSEKAVGNAYSYVMSKHAIVGMMRATCQDLAGKHIHTACICPGFTDTEMLRSHIPDQQLRETIGANNGFNRLIKADEIAELIHWAHLNPVINGSLLHAHLGQTER